MAGTFIVFEGGDGSGKDTLINLIKEKHADKNIEFVRDPGGTLAAEKIREFVLNKEAGDIDSRTELLLFLAARAETVAKVILPALEAGRIVVANRFTLSTIAYQVYGREHQDQLEFVKEASRFADQGLIPDLCILLDVDPKLGLERTTHREGGVNRFDEEKLAFHQRVRDGYKKHVGEFGKKTVQIDTTGTIPEAWKETEAALQSFL